jgi:hypothetical protein
MRWVKAAMSSGHGTIDRLTEAFAYLNSAADGSEYRDAMGDFRNAHDALVAYAAAIETAARAMSWTDAAKVIRQVHQQKEAA